MLEQVCATTAYSYSFYVLSAAIFFLLQGLLNIAFPHVAFFSNFKLHLLFAGITVLLR